MTPHQQGFVFSTLLHYRSVSDVPLGRILRRDEADVTRILANCGRNDLQDFEDFLNAQGLHLHIMDCLDLGIAPRPGNANKIFVLTRQRGERLALYFDNRWFIDAMKDRRRERTGEKSKKSERRDYNKTEIVFWFTRMWLTLQWFFYEKISRHPSQISRFRDALVLSSLFTDVLEEGIEKMGNAGRPEGEAGIMYDVYWKDRSKIRTWVNRFLQVMAQAGIIEETAVKDEYQQTLAAAVDMALIADRELACLMPPDNKDDVTSRSIMLITGAPLPINASQEGKNATH